MAAISLDAPARSRGKPALPFAGWIDAFGAWRRNRAAEAELRKMPDHVLRDLGITRTEIVTAVRLGRR